MTIYPQKRNPSVQPSLALVRPKKPIAPSPAAPGKTINPPTPTPTSVPGRKIVKPSTPIPTQVSQKSKPIILKKPVPGEELPPVQPQDPTKPFNYMAAGIVKGTFIPESGETPIKNGVLVTDDGVRYPAVINNTVLAKRFGRNPDLFSEPQFYYIYPKTFPATPGILMRISAIRRERENCPLEKIAQISDRFTVRGAVEIINEAKEGNLCRISVRINRNLTPPPEEKKGKRWQPFLVTLWYDKRFHTIEKKGFWEFSARRHPQLGLVIESARSFSPEPPQPRRKVATDPVTLLNKFDERIGAAH